MGTWYALIGVIYFFFLVYATVQAENLSFDLRGFATPELPPSGYAMRMYRVKGETETVSGVLGPTINTSETEATRVTLNGDDSSRRLRRDVRKGAALTGLTVVSNGRVYYMVDSSRFREETPPEEDALYLVVPENPPVTPWADGGASAINGTINGTIMGLVRT